MKEKYNQMPNFTVHTYINCESTVDLEKEHSYQFAINGCNIRKNMDLVFSECDYLSEKEISDFVAIVQLHIYCMPDIPDLSEMIFILDEETEDSSCSGQSVYNFIRKELTIKNEAGEPEMLSQEGIKEIDRGYALNIIEIHTLYINPKYRGKNISSFILQKLSEFLSFYFNINVGFVTTYINPFKAEPKIKLDEESGLMMPFLNGKMYCDYELDTEKVKIIRKMLKSLDFKSVDEEKRTYVTTISRLNKKAEKNGIRKKEKIILESGLFKYF